MGIKFSKKLHLRVPSKRVAMASRKVFCGARRPFITGIFTLIWDSQLLAEGHTIPVRQRVAFRGVSGAAEQHCGDSSPGMCTYRCSAPQNPDHSLARLERLIPTPAAAGSGAGIFGGPDFRERISNSAVNRKPSSPGEGDGDRLFLLTFQDGGSLIPPHCRGGSVR